MIIMRRMVFQTDNIKVGDQIQVSLGDLGTFTATAQMVNGTRALFLFDDYVAKRQMDENGSNEGGYENSDLKKWIDNDLFGLFPEFLKNHISGLSIPTVGEIFGLDEEWAIECLEIDADEQLPLMKQRVNRIAYYNDCCYCGWLRNTAKKKIHGSRFAIIDSHGNSFYEHESFTYGVRPEFWLDIQGGDLMP